MNIILKFNSNFFIYKESYVIAIQPKISARYSKFFKFKNIKDDSFFLSKIISNNFLSQLLFVFLINSKIVAISIFEIESIFNNLLTNSFI